MTIRRPERRDMRLWVALYRSPVVRKHMKGPLLRSAKEWWAGLRKQVTDDTGPLSVVLTSTGEFVGQCGFLEVPKMKAEWEIYCLFRRACWRQGYAREVCRALVSTAFSALHAERVLGIIDPANIASMSLVEKLGFRQEGAVAPANSWQNGHVIFAVSRTAYNMAVVSDAPRASGVSPSNTGRAARRTPPR
ncbi:MAG: GNAT family N-acetyltransferase [Betaproteobacteria bacterium]